MKPHGYWTFERCCNAALKCKTKQQFREQYESAYNIVCKRGWLSDVCGHLIQALKSAKYWTKVRCHEAALKCKTKNEFRKRFHGSIFEISQVVSLESYEKFYRIQTSGNFLYLPAMYLISAYEDFKKWIRYIGLVSSLTLLTASFMFLFGSRDFKTLETISNIGFFIMFITFFSWAYNVYLNYKKIQNKMEKN